MQRAFHLKANTAKNEALYVDFKGEKFIAPDERITPEMVAEIAALNEQFLGLSYRNMELLQKLAADPESADAIYFEKRLEELRADFPNDPLNAFNTVMKEMLERKLQKAASGPGTTDIDA
jgi:AbiV